MKNIGLYTAFAALLSLSSCNDSFLDLYPETNISSETFFQTADHFEQALIASYTGLRHIAQDGLFMDEMRSDNTFYTFYSADRGPYSRTEVIALFLDDESTNNWIEDRYKSDYSCIARTNTILTRVDEAALSDEEKQAIKAEALFLRAYYYFDLVQHWGGVPLVLTEISNELEAFSAKSSVEEVYTQILSDVSEAINLGLPVASQFPQSGRASLGAAKMLRAYVNASKPTRDYAAAEQDLKDITQMNYQLLSDYSDVFEKSNKNNKESILEVQYTEDGSTDQYTTIPWNLIPKCSNNEFLMGIAGSNYTGDNYNGASGGWCVPTQEMIQSYEEGDKRLDASIAVAEGMTDSGEQFTCEAVKSIVGYTPTTGKSYYYFVKKYYHPPYKYSLRADDNFPVYRYAGALLLLAEVLVKQNKNNEALPYINQVRARAGLPALSSVTIEDVMDEMRHELAFENHRWTDLIRNDMAIEVMIQFGEQMKALYPWILPSAFNVTKERLVYAFPRREMDINNLLEQNPGY
ncbi:RagB/SusD family nutrient uptake outer membrane protein [uncultured Parabacteroides sp.]|uniref:RagB/SusD family nutrient uptake outer membrane protein n=1 Tax=uncultured Parabacteroides sp. TaxID=512312 RepID=UPI002628C3F1|nr:RagB/SusD family nutrient uptake outer membrane protein [uncultured Parabacteroides sp.]